MDEWFDFGETIGHVLFTALSWGYTHWNGVGGAILMALQGWYLIKKIREK